MSCSSLVLFLKLGALRFSKDLDVADFFGGEGQVNAAYSGILS